MTRLIILMILIAALGIGALRTEGLEAIGAGLGLLDGMLLVLAVILILMRDSGEEVTTRRDPPRGDNGPDPIYYPDPPERVPDLRGPGPERFAPRGEYAEAQPHHALPPMRREPAETPIEVPDWPVRRDHE